MEAFGAHIGCERCGAPFFFTRRTLNMKQFKTHNQQLQVLRKKGLNITNASKAKRILES